MEIPLALSFDDVLLVPQRTPLRSRSQADTAGWVTPQLKIAAPFLSSNMDTVTGVRLAVAIARLGGLGVIHQFQSIEKEAAQVSRVKKASLPVAAAVGVANRLEERAQSLVAAGADLLVVDAAHGHSALVRNAVRLIKKKFPPLPVLAGNVATAAGARFLLAAGADALKVGIGPGSVCTTRIITGAGIPQLSAVLAAAAVIKKMNRPIGLVSDGGVKQPGDAVKALAAGATAVMCGNIFASADEASGRVVIRGGVHYKRYRGSSTLSAAHSRRRRGELSRDINEQWSRVEGVEALVPARGPLEKIVGRFLGGLRSGISYTGARNLRELQKNARFVRITAAGRRESWYHDVVI